MAATASPTKTTNEDFSLYFFTILGEVRSELPDGREPSVRSIVIQLSAQEGMFLLFHEKTLQELKQPIHQFCQGQRLNPKDAARFRTVIQQMYPLALMNSQTQKTLEETNKELITLYEKVQGLDLGFLLSDVSAFVQRPNGTTKASIEEQLEVCATLYANLEPHLALKMHTSSIENIRMLDLARATNEESDERPYDVFTRIYPKVIDILNHKELEIRNVTRLTKKLVEKRSALMLQMASIRRQERGDVPEPSPKIKEMRLLFDENFLQAVYPMLWKALCSRTEHEPSARQKFPALNHVDYLRENEAILIQILYENCPKFDIDHWLNTALMELPAETFHALSSQLYLIHDQKCALYQSSSVIPEELQALDAKMTQICAHAMEQIKLDLF